MLDKILTAFMTVALATLIYKVLPFRKVGDKKPFLAFFPKYKIRVYHTLNNEELENKLSKFGFKKVNETKGLLKFSRGSVLGDLSIKLSKVSVSLHKIEEGVHDLTVQATWVAAFDTGDHWQLTKELGSRIVDA